MSEMSPELMQKRLDRAVLARQEAEKLLEERSKELYSMNLVLQKAADRLSLQHAQLDKILEIIWTGVLLLDQQHKVVRSNAYAERAFQYEAELLVGKDISSLAACSHDQIDKLITLGLDVEENQSEMEILGYRSDGERFPLKLAISETLIQEKKHFIWIFQDLTIEKRNREKREKLEEELRRALRLESLGTLASGLAHEINTPVQYVGDNLHFLNDAFSDLLEVCKGLSEVPETIADGLLIENEQRHDVDIDFLQSEIPKAVSQALEGVKRVTDIICSVRNFSHPGAKERSFLDLNEAIRNTITISRNQWKYVAEVDYDLDEDIPKVLCMPGEINQVLLNLIVNAAHAIEEKQASEQGTITIQTRSVLDYVEVRIKDSGCGISSQNRERVFDPFFTTKGVGKGTGQGLSLAYNIIVTGHQGKIIFESEEGVGTTFIVLLPAGTGEEQDSVVEKETV